MEISSSTSVTYADRTAMQSPPPPKKELSTEPLTEEQQTALDEILANYEGSEASPEVMDAIFTEMRDADIPMSEDTQEILEAQGFGPPEKPMGPPPEGGMGGAMGELSSLDDETKDTLVTLLESFMSGDLDRSSFDSEIESLGLEELVGNLFSEKA